MPRMRRKVLLLFLTLLPAPAWSAETPEPVRLDLYVMSHCPFGVQAENAVLPAVKALGRHVDFTLNFIANEDSGGSGNVGIGTTNPGQVLDVAGVIRTNTGVQFPTTQNPSSDLNTLDDYEEGTWTPVIGGSGGTSGQTYGTQAGQYVKVGKLVTAWFEVDLGAKGTITGNVQIQGLPFTSAVGPGNQPIWIGPMIWNNLATNWVNIVGRVSSNSTVALVFGATAAGTTNETNLVTGDISNTTTFRGTFIYRSAD